MSATWIFDISDVLYKQTANLNYSKIKPFGVLFCETIFSTSELYCNTNMLVLPLNEVL